MIEGRVNPRTHRRTEAGRTESDARAGSSTGVLLLEDSGAGGFKDDRDKAGQIKNAKRRLQRLNDGTYRIIGHYWRRLFLILGRRLLRATCCSPVLLGHGAGSQ